MAKGTHRQSCSRQAEAGKRLLLTDVRPSLFWLSEMRVWVSCSVWLSIKLVWRMLTQMNRAISAWNLVYTGSVQLLAPLTQQTGRVVLVKNWLECASSAPVPLCEFKVDSAAWKPHVLVELLVG